jgi:hypothetical protein
MAKESVKDTWLPCTYGCLNKRGLTVNHRGANSCPKARRASKGGVGTTESAAAQGAATTSTTPHVSNTSDAVAGNTVAAHNPISQPSQPVAQLTRAPSTTAQDPSPISQSSQSVTPAPLTPTGTPAPSTTALKASLGSQLSQSHGQLTRAPSTTAQDPSPISQSSQSVTPAPLTPTPSTTAQDPSPISQSSQSVTPAPLTPAPSTTAQDPRSVLPPPAMSPQIPSPTRQTGIPETPQQRRHPFGSPVRAPRDFGYDLLEPSLRPGGLSSRFRRDSTTETVSDEEEIESLTGSGSQSKTALDDADDESKKRGKRPRLNVKTVEFQKDKRKRESYYRNTSDRLKEKLQVLGVYTGCFGVLYLHRS